MISMIAELRFVFGENETMRILRERELVIYGPKWSNNHKIITI